jgi:multidrug efflux pump subunit AcrA (membrane-fusion protein)
VKRWLLVALCACQGSAAKHAATGEVTRTQVVKRGDITERVLLTGDLHAVSSVDLSVPRTETWQLVIRWLAEDGASVKAGDRVVEFDNSAVTQQLEQKHIALLEAELTFRTSRDLARIETENKQNVLLQHQIALEKAKVRADVPADLLPAREAQERQLEKKRMEVEVKKAEADAIAQKQESELELHVKQIELDKARRAIEASEKTIADLVLKAPKDGIAVIDDHPWEGRRFHLGDTVQPGMTIMSMPDMSQAMEVHSELSDVDDGRVAIGMKGTCTLDAYPETPITCTVTELTPVARVKGEQSLRRAFAVKLTLAAADGSRMHPNMSVKIELAKPPVKNVIVVPRGALVVDGKTTRVRLAGGLRDVKVGACDAQGCAVDTGVAEGDTVVLGGGA